ncbi:MAG: peptide-methionine (S)-S-oxide reductase [Chloroflexi bacterium]|nr:peptide-methionine (S)-S-oxide reductase [Chloroflexota bacterium]
MDSRFGSIPGVIRTRVGYAGGTKESPTYYDLGDHSESIEIEYDPTQVSYEELLAVFWDTHNPTQPAYSRQYMSAIFFHDESQKELAIASKESEANRLQATIHTLIAPAGHFTQAEDYHQKYLLRQRGDLLVEYQSVYPDVDDFIRSTAVARVNGYLGGYGTVAQLEAELESLGLSAEGQQTLVSLVRRSGR